MNKGSKAARVMGGEKKKSGKKKSVHRMEIRRANSGGYVVTHHAKPDPNNPMGQEPEEHVVGDVDQLQQHVASNMGDQPEAEQQEPEPAAPAAASAPVQGA